MKGFFSADVAQNEQHCLKLHSKKMSTSCQVKFPTATVISHSGLPLKPTWSSLARKSDIPPKGNWIKYQHVNHG